MHLKASYQSLTFAAMGALFGTSAQAHEGHGDTLWHAFMHMIESNGAPLLFAMGVILVMLMARARRLRQSRMTLLSTCTSQPGSSSGDSHDSR